jgi:hypothetical protein
MNLSKLTNPKAMAEYIAENRYPSDSSENLERSLIKDALGEASSQDVIDAYNDYLRNYYPGDCYIEFNDEEIDNTFSSHWDALMACYYGSVNMSDEYFRLNGYGHIETKSTSDIVFEAINDDSFIDYLNNNRKEVSRIDYGLEEALDFIDSEWEEVEAEIKKAN